MVPLPAPVLGVDSSFFGPGPSAQACSPENSQAMEGLPVCLKVCFKEIAETIEYWGSQSPHSPAGAQRPGKAAASDSLAAAPVQVGTPLFETLEWFQVMQSTPRDE